MRHGDPGSAAKLAFQASKKIAQAEQAEKNIARSERLIGQVLNIQARKEMAEHTRKAKIESDKRAVDWQYEKEELAAKNRFAFETERRNNQLMLEDARAARNQEMADAKEARRVEEEERLWERIVKDETISPSEKKLFRHNMDAKRIGAPMLSKETQEKEPSFAAKKAALAAISEEKEAEDRIAKFLPWGKTGEPTPEQTALADEARRILGIGEVTDPADVDLGAGIDVVPKSLADFENTVKQLNSTDPRKAKQYYDRYGGRF